MVDQRASWHNRSQFCGVAAAEMMRRILVDRARARRAAKRSGQWARVTLDDAIAVTRSSDVDILDLDAALTRLAALDPCRAGSRSPLLRGLSPQETGDVLDVSVATVERDWQFARVGYDALSSPPRDSAETTTGLRVHRAAVWPAGGRRGSFQVVNAVGVI
jgi:RNA polymerase sigma factor (TIGR02999 family)